MKRGEFFSAKFERGGLNYELIQSSFKFKHEKILIHVDK